MLSVQLRIFLICILLILGARVRAAVADSRQVDALIRDLAEPDPTVRQNAARRLLDMGLQIRPALKQAVQSDHPQIRARAGQLLMELPWHRPADAPIVRQMLEGYGSREENERAQVAGNLAAQGKAEEVIGPLLRLMDEESSDLVRWEISRALRVFRDGPSLERFQELEQRADHTAEFVLAGWSWMDRDPARSRELFRRAVELEQVYPTRDNGQMGIPFGVLTMHAQHHARWDEAAEMYRLQAARAGDLAEVPQPVFDLFVLHADHGPLKGFDDDLRHYGRYLGRPLMLYPLGRIHEKAGRRLAADAFYATARAANTGHAQLRLYTAERLIGATWHDLAWREAAAALVMGDAQSYGIAQRAYELLSHVAMQWEDDAMAAQCLQAALEVAERHGNAPEGRELDEVRALVHWRSFRALKEKDAEKARAHLEQVLKLMPRNIEITMDMVPHLKEKGRHDEAAKLFKLAYDEMRTELDGEPENPEHKNNLAWLCARSGERLEEALELSEQAVEAAPFNPAYIDTLAECHFRLGNAKKAVELETRALEIWPDDQFMREQLERFRAGL